MNRDNFIQKLSERELNPSQCADCWEAFHKINSIVRAYEAFSALISQTLPQVKLKSLGLKLMTKELQAIMKFYYIPFLIELYKWDKIFGVCPWYLTKLSKSEHFVPIVPKFGSGRITTYLNKRNIQKFKWYWRFSTEPDKRFNFEVKHHAPDIDGTLHSPISSILDDFRTLRIFRQAHEIGAYAQAHQQHVFEYHPPRNQIGDDNLMTLEGFGDEIAGAVMATQESLQSKKAQIRADDFYAAISSASASNRGIQQKFGRSAVYLKSEESGNAWEMQNVNAVERGIALRADISYKHVPPPHVTADFLKLREIIEHNGSSMMDIPLGAIETSGGKNVANVQGILRFINERIKDWTRHGGNIIQKILVMSYGQVVEAELQNQRKILRVIQPEKHLNYMASEEIKVKIAATPLLAVQDVLQLATIGFMKDEVAAAHIFNILGLPEEEISIDKAKLKQFQNPETKKSSGGSTKI